MLERIDSGEATPMDLDIMASVQEQIMGNCLCVLGDAMAMPVGSMIDEVPRRVRGRTSSAAARARLPHADDVIPLAVADEHAGSRRPAAC